MLIAKILTTVFIATLVLAATDSVAKDSVYRWVDDQGVVHYSDLPASTTDATKVAIDAGNPTNNHMPAQDSADGSIYQSSTEPSRAQQQRDEREKARQEAAQRKAAIDTACKQRRNLVTRLEPFTRVMVKGEDGETYRMDDNDRLNKLHEAKTFIAENCN